MRRTAIRRAAWLAAVLASTTLACTDPRGERLRVVDLLEREGSAEKRPVDGAFELRERTCGGASRTVLAVPATSRLTWSLPLPARGVLTAGAAVEGAPGATVTFRVGVSDHRIYDALESITVSADECGRAWVPVAVDLSRYAGVKFSLFYQPNRQVWRLVLATNAAGGAVERAYWARPAIEADAASAKEYFSRAARLDRR